MSNAHQQIQNLAEAVRLIVADPNQGVATAAAALGLSYSSLYRLFRNLVGLSPKRYAGVMRYYRLVGALLADAPAGGLALLAASKAISIKPMRAAISGVIQTSGKPNSGAI
ncbi:MAG: AraC family transcriptional regulator [Mesorhizobium sp.]|nr:MAG: AraC family transcriptional regulator [Mesorhizobium sp.]TIM80954.1 MAG: AraC family transcriptional regulator [Mesorhizobium sp.]